MRCLTVPALLLALVAAVPGMAGEADRCPLLVTVDDLPIAAGGLHPDPAERRRITDGLLAALARHGIRAVGRHRGLGTGQLLSRRRPRRVGGRPLVAQRHGRQRR